MGKLTDVPFGLLLSPDVVLRYGAIRVSCSQLAPSLSSLTSPRVFGASQVALSSASQRVTLSASDFRNILPSVWAMDIPISIVRTSVSDP